MFGALLTAAGAFAASILAIVIYPYVAYYRMRKIIGKIPGPPRKNFIVGNLANLPPRPDRPEFFLNLIRQYGKNGAMSFFMGPFPVVNVNGPKYIKEVMSSSKHTTKSNFYSTLHPWLGLGLLTSSGEKWKIMRRLTTPAFHFEVLHRFLDVMNEQSNTLIERLEAHAEKGDTFDAFELVTACALDIICETAMGKKVGAQAITGHTEYVDAVYRMSRSIVNRMEKPILTNDFIYSLTGAGRQDKRDLKLLHGFAHQVIRERKELLAQQKANEEEAKKRRPAFLDILINAQASGEDITDENIREEVDTFMFEGHDTTSASMGWTLHLLGKYPEIQERLYQEIKEVMGDEGDISYDMLNQFRYLEMILKESLRMYPSVAGIGRLLTEDVEIEGVVVPAGSQVLVSIYSVQNNPAYWESPEKFDPERWTPENSEGRDPYQYIPFSAGPRNCIGQKFAQNEEKVIIAKIIKHYKVTAMEENPKKMPELILRPLNGIQVKISKRA